MKIGEEKGTAHHFFLRSESNQFIKINVSLIFQYDHFLWKWDEVWVVSYNTNPTGVYAPALSLVNEAQFLLINRASVALLLDHIVNK